MTAPAGNAATYSLSIGRRLRAPIAAVFDAWTDPELLRVWMKPRPEAAVIEAHIDATVGGTFVIVMSLNGREERHQGVYRVVDRPGRLSFSWSSAPAGPDTTVDVTLLAAPNDHTMILLKHDRLPTHAARENHREGWRRILDHLAETIERR